MPADSTIMHMVAEHGREVLQQGMRLDHLPEPGSGPGHMMLKTPRFFQQNKLTCAAYVKSSRTLEVCTVSSEMYAACAILKQVTHAELGA